MSHDPELRYARATDLCDDLTALSSGRTTQARQLEGGVLRRSWTQLRFYTSGHPYEYKSKRTFLGLPLVHVFSGRRYPGQPKRVAKGWLAAGDVAFGGMAFGAVAVGGIACGGASAGLLFSWGGVSLALLLAFGGLSFGFFSWGGIALGYFACGGIALGFGAIGGIARGTYAMGGLAQGKYVITDGREDVTHQEWFEGVLPWLMQFIGGES